MTDRPLRCWRPGTSGKGLLVRGASPDDITLETWPTDEAGDPPHAEGARRLVGEWDSVVGVLVIYPQGHFDVLGMNDAERRDLVSEALRQCPELRSDPGPDQLEWRIW